MTPLIFDFAAMNAWLEGRARVAGKGGPAVIKPGKVDTVLAAYGVQAADCRGDQGSRCRSGGISSTRSETRSASCSALTSCRRRVASAVMSSGLCRGQIPGYSSVLPALLHPSAH